MMITIINLSLIVVVLLLISFMENAFCLTRINFSKCGVGGFTCITNSNKKINLIYSCPINVNDVLIYINSFAAPTTAEKFTIRNCDTLTIATRCSNEIKSIQYLEISNIRLLNFQRLQYQPMLPPTVVLENIRLIDSIPVRTFAQVEKAYHTIGCTIPKIDFDTLLIRNVTINRIEPEAIVGLESFKNFSLYDVKIATIQTSAIRLNMNLANYNFALQNSKIDTVESLGIQLVTHRAIISKSYIGELFPSSINGSIEDFLFSNNHVATFHPYGISILATNVFILENKFEHLKSGALEKFSPGLFQVSGRNFGKLKFVYDFSKNDIQMADVNSLHPDYLAYGNIQTELVFRRNRFICNCENVGWLFSDLHHNQFSYQDNEFYKLVLNTSNTCASMPCEMSVKTFGKFMISDPGTCNRNGSISKVCNQKMETTEKPFKISKTFVRGFVEHDLSSEITKLSSSTPAGVDISMSGGEKSYLHLAILFCLMILAIN